MLVESGSGWDPGGAVRGRPKRTDSRRMKEDRAGSQGDGRAEWGVHPALRQAAENHRAHPLTDGFGNLDPMDYPTVLVHSICGGRTAAQVGFPLGSVRPNRPTSTPDT